MAIKWPIGTEAGRLDNRTVYRAIQVTVWYKDRESH